MERKVLAIAVTESGDLPGVWVAHLLNIDLVTQGNSVENALQNLSEAFTLVAEDDLALGLNVLDRSPAPPEDWQEWLDQVRAKR